LYGLLDPAASANHRIGARIATREHNPHVHVMISERGNDGIDRDREHWFRRANRAQPEHGGSSSSRLLNAIRGYALSARAARQSVNAMPMKKRATKQESSANDLRAEYAFDYGKARPNRFATRMSGNVVAIVLDPDVARVFNSSQLVNELLRSVISAMPPGHDRKARSARRKAS
jgi:hypothetical protein